jgi:hypothetical protein
VIQKFSETEHMWWHDRTISKLAGQLENHLRGTPGWFLDLGELTGPDEINSTGEPASAVVIPYKESAPDRRNIRDRRDPWIPV